MVLMYVLLLFSVYFPFCYFLPLNMDNSSDISFAARFNFCPPPAFSMLVIVKCNSWYTNENDMTITFY